MCPVSSLDSDGWTTRLLCAVCLPRPCECVVQARGAIANFMGHIEVQPEESNYRLTPGLWLVGLLPGMPIHLFLGTLALSRYTRAGAYVIQPDFERMGSATSL